MPNWPSSPALVIVTPCTASLLMPYAVGAPYAAKDEMLTIDAPGRPCIASCTASVQLIVPIRFTSKSRLSLAMPDVAIGSLYAAECRPALLMRMSMPPNRPTTLATTAAMPGSSATSASYARGGTAGGADLGRSLLGHRPLDVDQHRVGATGRERVPERLAEPPAPAGDDGCPAGELLLVHCVPS